MNVFGSLVTAVLIILQLQLPRSQAAFPLLAAGCFITVGQQLEVIGLHFPVFRVLICAGLLRAMVRRERITGSLGSIDRMIILWTIWNACSLIFHKPAVLAFRLGGIYDVFGAYYLFRVFIQKPEDVQTVFTMICLLLGPLSAMMLIEKRTGENPLSRIGFGPSDVAWTNGHFRAQGPFGHPILAGTVGAVCFPMAVYFWRTRKGLALTGVAATLTMVFASGSSGPVVTTFLVAAALAIWSMRNWLSTIRWCVVLVIIALAVVMHDPVYYLVARIDITGGSTGYFRARLIQSAIEHLDEWWSIGTDYTRHWMASGISANPDHTDMTNYYIQMGVWGGLPLVLLFMGVLYAAFERIGKYLRLSRPTAGRKFMAWTLGCILLGHMTAFLSISYFDQTVIFLCLVLACIGSLRTMQVPSPTGTRVEAGVLQGIS